MCKCVLTLIWPRFDRMTKNEKMSTENAIYVCLCILQYSLFQTESTVIGHILLGVCLNNGYNANKNRQIGRNLSKKEREKNRGKDRL